MLEDFNIPYVVILVCDETKRSTCKSRKEIADFVRFSNFYVLIQQNQILIDRFELNERD